MRSEVYIDIIFLTNLFMDYLLLRGTGILLSCRIKRRRCIAAAFAGSIASCLIFCIPSEPDFSVLILIHGICAILMLKISYGIKKRGLLLKAILTLYLLAFLAGGFWEVFMTDRSMTMQVFLIGAGITWAGSGALTYLWDSFQIKKKNIYPVTLFYRGKSSLLYGFYDSGNLLTDSVNNRPVSMIDAEATKKLFSENVLDKLKNLKEQPERIVSRELLELHPHFITYRTVGGEGMLLAITLEKIQIHAPKELIEIESPIFAIIFDSSIWKSDYRILLNSRLM